MNVLRFFCLLFCLAFLIRPDVSAVSPEPPCPRISFQPARFDWKEQEPIGWLYRQTPFTAKPQYRILQDPKSDRFFLRIQCGKAASGVLVHDLGDILRTRPVMRWKWRVNKFPEKADGRGKLDDQAIAIYIGETRIGSRSLGYRWETETPNGHKAHISYGLGSIRVHWTAVRSKADGSGKWIIEQRNLAEDFRAAYHGEFPRRMALSISTNTQYTRSGSSADIEWIEFLPLSALQQKLPDAGN